MSFRQNIMAVFEIEELTQKILHSVDSGQQYKTVRLVCRQWHRLAGERLEEFINTLWTLIQRYPNLLWNWMAISRNPNITLDIIERHPEMPWQWDAVAHNPNITCQFVLDHLHETWDWYHISKRLPWKFIKTHRDLSWNLAGLLGNPEMVHGKTLISRYEKMGLQYCVVYPADSMMNFTYLSDNKGLTDSILLRHIDAPWDWQKLSTNHNLTWD